MLLLTALIDIFFFFFFSPVYTVHATPPYVVTATALLRCCRHITLMLSIRYDAPLCKPFMRRALSYDVDAMLISYGYY